jgi:uncharacterized protein YigA (DUF484 family)
VKRIAELEGRYVAEERGLVPPKSDAGALRARVGQLESVIQALETRANQPERDLEAARKLNRDLVRENSRDRVLER